MMIPEKRSVLHSWCVQAEWDAPQIVGGKGAKFWDDAGRVYLDMSSLAECMNLGHQHPRIIRAIQEQAAKLCFVTSSWGAEPRAALAARLLEVSGFAGGRVFFTLGGSDANENAVKFARQASGKRAGKIITRDRSYHGASYAAMALSGDSRTQDVDPGSLRRRSRAAAVRLSLSARRRHADECAARNVAHIGAEIRRLGAENVAAVLMEPNAGTNGIVAPPSHWPLLRAETAAAGVLLIADEVMSGFGRCGDWFAWQRHGDSGRPDMMTLAKGLTGAHVPLGAVVLSPQVADRLEHSMLLTGLTYCGHPLACAAGLAAIETYAAEGLIERSRALGRALFERLLAMQRTHAVIGDVRGGDGLFAVVELVKDRGTREPLSAWPAAHPSMRAFLARALAQGVSFAARGNLLILAPPLVIGASELQDALDLMDSLLGELDWS